MAKKQKPAVKIPAAPRESAAAAVLEPPLAPAKAAAAADWPASPWLVLIPAALACVAFYPGLSNGFVHFDDTEAILRNPVLRNPSLSGFFSGQNLGMYAPVTWITYWFGFLISGEEAFGYHLLSLALHAVNAALLFLVVRRLTGRGWLALFSAALFAVHPVQTEAVSWAAALSTVLYVAFYLASLLAYLRWRSIPAKTPAWLALSLVLFLAACLSKSAAVTLPLLLIAIDYLKDKKQLGKLWVSKIPYFLLAFIFGLYTYTTREQAGFDAAIHNVGFTAFDRVLMVTQTLLFYPVKLLAPFGFSVSYPFPASGTVWPWTYYVAPLAVAGLGWAIWKYFRHNRLVLLGVALYLLPLVVMLPHQTIGSLELRSDRYVYLSSAGIFVLLALALERLDRTVRLALLGGAVVALGLLAWRQTRVWNNGVALFEHCVEHTPEATLCQCNLAYSELISLDFENSVRHYTAALALDPQMYECYNGRGQAYLNLKKIPEALDDFNKAVEAGISTPKLFFNRGKCLLMLNRPAEALPDLDKSLELEPNAAETYYFRGASREKTGNTAGAVQDYTETLNRQSDHIKALVNRGMLHFNADEFDAAIADFSAALRHNTGLAMIWTNRANAYLKRGDLQPALADAEQALKIDAKYAPAYRARGQILVQLGRTADGQADLQKAQSLMGER